MLLQSRFCRLQSACRAQDIVQSLLTTFTYCDTTQRFLPGAKTGEPPSLDSHAEPAMLWGPGGSDGLFASWASAHAAFVGHSHLSALLNLTGQHPLCVAR